MTDPSRSASPDTIATAAIELMTSSPVGSTEQWIHLMPSGTFGGRDGRGPYRLAGAAAVIETSRRYAVRYRSRSTTTTRSTAPRRTANPRRPPDGSTPFNPAPTASGGG